MRHSIESGETIDRPDLLVGVDEIMALIGDDKVSALEEQFLLPEQLQKKYG